MIPFIDFKREYSFIKKEIDEAISRVLERGRFILGPEVENFEKSFARYCGTKYCVGVNSGTDALYLSLLCVGIGRGDEVVVPVNTALPTAMAVLMSGARPIFVDCDESFLSNLNQTAKIINKKTRAIIAVHLYGRACNMEKLKKIAGARNLVLIEDCAQASGAFWKNRKVGNWGDFGCFSFYPTKNLGAYGDGGAIITNNKNYYDKLLAMRFYGQPDRIKCLMFGVNSRLDELQAAILNVKLKYLDTWNKKRREIAGLYRRFITNPEVILPEAKDKKGHVHHLFVVRSKKRNVLMNSLKNGGVQIMIHYPVPLHQQPIFQNNIKGSFPHAELYSSEIFSLPMHPFLQEKEIKKVADILNEKTK
jgi:dTDP-4-amino-4,6-dideoxygalactose transaminase